MVSPALQSAIEPIELPEDQEAMIRSRAAELEAEPSIGLTWEELQARLGSRWA